MSSQERWDKYFLRIAEVVATGSKCLKRQVGAVIVDRYRRVIATGFNGKPRNTCMDDICLRENVPSGTSQEIICCIHAEENALLFVDFQACQGGSLYITHPPCKICAPKIVQSGVSRLIFYADSQNRDQDGLAYIHQLGFGGLDAVNTYDKEV